MLYLFLLFIFLLTLWGIKFKDNDDFLSKDRCNSIKGIFILVVLFKHAIQYINDSGFEYHGLDLIPHLFLSYSGQLIVVMFLFYSGYGVAYSILNKGEQYVNHMPRRRLLTTLLNFDVAVCAFILMNLVLSIPMSAGIIVEAFFAWETLGNSNWYIFAILLCYALTYLVAKTVKTKNQWKWLFVVILIAELVLSCLKESYWYNTLLVYPAGFAFAVYKDNIVAWMKRYYAVLIVVLTAAFIVFFYFVPQTRALATNFASICFALVIVMLSMKIVVGNPFLNWCGVNLFPLYIYQRIPMIVMYECIGEDFVKNYALLFVVLALVVTCGIARLYKYWQIR